MPLLLATLPLFLPALTGTPKPATDPPVQPNFLVIVIDDASREEFAESHMPNLQALAPFGRLFQNFYTSTVCSPTRYQLQYGRYPFRAGIGKALGSGTSAGAVASELSVAEVLEAEGYSTGLFGKWHVNGGDSPLAIEEAPRIQGFQAWRAGSIGNITDGKSHHRWLRVDDGEFKDPETTYSSDAIFEAWEQWWVEEDAKPKFGVLSYLAPHSPFDHPDQGPLGSNPGPGVERANYEAALEHIDDQLLDIVSLVDLSDTFVFLLSDNGTPPQVSPPGGLEAGYKTTPFEGGIHVRLMVWGPGVAAGVDPSLIQAADLSTTLMGLCSAGPCLGFEDSISFLPCLFQPGLPSARTHVFSQRFSPNAPDPSEIGPLEFNEWAVIRDDGFKLCHLKQQPIGIPGPSTGSLFRLYHLPTDPFEGTDLYGAGAFENTAQELEDFVCELLGPDWPFLPDECTAP